LNWQKQINEPKPHIFEQYRLFEQEIEKFDDMAKIAYGLVKILLYGTEICGPAMTDQRVLPSPSTTTTVPY
jgi:hypothetical protein